MRNNVTIWHTSCERCGIVISQIGSGRPRKYCYGSCNPRAPKVRKPKTGGRAQWVRDQKIARGECADCGWASKSAYDLNDSVVKVLNLDAIPVVDLDVELKKPKVNDTGDYDGWVW